MSLQLASPFQDHAVLQRDQVLPVWGWTTPSTRVRVTLAGNEAHCLSNAHGDFLVRLPALPAGGPHTLTVELPATGEKRVLKDILVGEVWLASGQSNMNWKLEQSVPVTADDIANADFPAIRFFDVERSTHLGPHRTVNGKWQSASPATAPQFSAVAFSFARRLHNELGVPVGILSSSWGGTIAQTWTSRSTLALNPDLTDWLAGYDASAWTPERWKDVAPLGPDGRIINYPMDPGVTQPWAASDLDDSKWPNIDLPATWQSAGHKHSGVFWFRRTVELPADWLGGDLTLELGALDKQDITYANGVEIGRTGKDREERYWNVPRTYTIPGSLITGRTLVIAVRVYSFIYDGGFLGPATKLRLTRSGEPQQPDSGLSLVGPWRFRCEHDLGVVAPPKPVMGHGEPNSPHMLFDNMIQPLIPYALRGAIWYQGESNEGNPGQYTRLLRDLIEDWRRQWGKADLAFHLVQLANFRLPQAHQADSAWARIREAQTAALALPHTGMAVAIDVGDANDIHPLNKVPVGERLAQSALAVTYGRPITPGGPIADTFAVSGSTLRCDFRNAESGLTTTDGAAPSHVFLAGEDRIFHPAIARIDGASLIITSDAVPHPVAVRYAWADNPEGCNLANAEMLPASPFRSDRW